jgi:polyisoprenoid-binding protein YceI
MRTILFLFFAIFAVQSIQAQETYITRSGIITFYSKTPLEDIEAVNKSVNATIRDNGQVAFKVLMKSFVFEKAAMQQHFNDDYVESDKYPDAKFEGLVEDFHKIDLAKNGSYPVNVQGHLTIHGVKKPIKTPGTVIVKDKDLILQSTFNIELSDYNISVPSNYLKKISNTIEIKVNAALQVYVR